MPELACWSCGRQIYTVAPLEALFAEERRCPRCGAFLEKDRRQAEQRMTHRRSDLPDEPGPPKRKGKRKASADDERRVTERRTTKRRGKGTPPPAAT
jgi:hypothetical protein